MSRRRDRDQSGSGPVANTGHEASAVVDDSARRPRWRARRRRRARGRRTGVGCGRPGVGALPRGRQRVRRPHAGVAEELRDPHVRPERQDRAAAGDGRGDRPGCGSGRGARTAPPARGLGGAGGGRPRGRCGGADPSGRDAGRRGADGGRDRARRRGAARPGGTPACRDQDTRGAGGGGPDGRVGRRVGSRADWRFGCSADRRDGRRGPAAPPPFPRVVGGCGRARRAGDRRRPAARSGRAGRAGRA